MKPQNAHAQPSGSWGLASQPTPAPTSLSPTILLTVCRTSTYNSTAELRAKSATDHQDQSATGAKSRDRVGLLKFDLSGIKGKIIAAQLNVSAKMNIDSNHHGQSIPSTLTTQVFEANDWPQTPSLGVSPAIDVLPATSAFASNTQTIVVSSDAVNHDFSLDESQAVLHPATSHPGWVGFVFKNTSGTPYTTSDFSNPKLVLSVEAPTPTPTPTPSSNVLSLESDTRAICAGGLNTPVHQAHLTATFKTSSGAVLPGRTVHFSWQMPNATKPSTADLKTNSQSQALLTITSGDTVGPVRVSAKCEDKDAGTDLSVEPTGGYGIATPKNVYADGQSQFTITMSLLYRGKAVEGHLLSWHVTKVWDETGQIVNPDATGNYPGYGSFVPSSAISKRTDAQGHAVQRYTAGTKVGKLFFEGRDETVFLYPHSTSTSQDARTSSMSQKSLSLVAAQDPAPTESHPPLPNGDPNGEDHSPVTKVTFAGTARACAGGVAPDGVHSFTLTGTAFHEKGAPATKAGIKLSFDKNQGHDYSKDADKPKGWTAKDIRTAKFITSDATGKQNPPIEETTVTTDDKGQFSVTVLSSDIISTNITIKAKWTNDKKVDVDVGSQACVFDHVESRRHFGIVAAESNVVDPIIPPNASFDEGFAQDQGWLFSKADDKAATPIVVPYVASPTYDDAKAGKAILYRAQIFLRFPRDLAFVPSHQYFLDKDAKAVETTAVTAANAKTRGFKANGSATKWLDMNNFPAAQGHVLRVRFDSVTQALYATTAPPTDDSTLYFCNPDGTACSGQEITLDPTDANGIATFYFKAGPQIMQAGQIGFRVFERTQRLN